MNEKKPEKIKISRFTKKPIKSEVVYGVLCKIYEKNNIFTANFSRKINQLREREAFFHDAQKFDFKEISDIVQHFGVEVSFWFSPRYSKKHKNKILLPVKVKSFTPESEPLLQVHFLLNKENDPINLQTENLSVIISEEKFFEFLTLPLTFWECLSSKLDMSIDDLKAKWGKTEIRFHDERKFFSIFKTGFTIWQLKSVLKNDVNSVEQNIIFQSAYDNNILLQSLNEKWDFEKTTISPDDRFCLANEKSFEVFRCPNDFCSYADRVKANFVRHVKSCTNVTKYNFSQTNKKDQSIADWLISEGFLKKIPEQKDFIAFDCETLGDANSKIISDHTNINSSFRLATISVTKSSGESKVFVRESSTEDAYVKLVADFYTYLLKYRDEYRAQLPDDINNAFFTIKDLLFRKKTDPDYVKLPPRYHGKLRRAFNYLNKIREAKVVGFNSESFDLPVLVPAFMKAWTSKYFRSLNKNEKIPREPKPHVIKRGSGFLTLGFLGIRFVDMHNFFTSGSLAKAGEVFDVPDQKLLFPYEKYSSVEDLSLDSSFPPYSHFRSTLCLSNDSFDITQRLNDAFIVFKTNSGLNTDESFRQFKELMQIDAFAKMTLNNDNLPQFIVPTESSHNFPYDPVKYIENVFIFRELKSSGKITNMLEYLSYYNQCDTVLTMRAFSKMINAFSDKFSVNLLDFYSMPSVAGHLLWQKFDQTVAAPFSLPQKFGYLGHRFRKACDGGLATPKHRHVASGSQADLFSDCVGKTPDGNKNVEITGVDFNSLYPYGESLDLPCGPGFMYSKTKSGKFKWETMKSKDLNWSLPAIEWINYQNNLPPFKNGDQLHYISHALNHGEVKVKMDDVISYPDGFAEVGGVKYYLYFHGCRFHYHQGCSISEKANIFEEKKSKDEKVRKWCRANGVYIEIFDCQWRQMKKKLEYKNFSSCFFNRQKLINEEEILEKIDEGTFFGCIEIDIESSQEAINHFSKLNWPPIYTKVDVEESMVQPKLLKNVKNFKTVRQLTQVFNAKNYLITTDLYKFYKSKGMRFSNLSFAVEFQKGRPLKKFVDELVDCRVAADIAKQTELVSLYKLILNSSYGYLLINKSKVNILFNTQSNRLF